MKGSGRRAPFIAASRIVLDYKGEGQLAAINIAVAWEFCTVLEGVVVVVVVVVLVVVVAVAVGLILRDNHSTNMTPTPM